MINKQKSFFTGLLFFFLFAAQAANASERSPFNAYLTDNSENISSEDSAFARVNRPAAGIKYVPEGYPSMRVNIGYNYLENMKERKYNSVDYGFNGHNIAASFNLHF